MLPAVIAGVALLSHVLVPGGSESLRFTGTPLSGRSGTRIDLVSIDPCPAPVPGALWMVYVMFVPPAHGRARFLHRERFPVRSDGSWAATVTATGDQVGDATIEAACETDATAADYEPVSFRLTAS